MCLGLCFARALFARLLLTQISANKATQRNVSLFLFGSSLKRNLNQVSAHLLRGFIERICRLFVAKVKQTRLCQNQSLLVLSLGFWLSSFGLKKSLAKTGTTLAQLEATRRSFAAKHICFVAALSLCCEQKTRDVKMSKCEKLSQFASAAYCFKLARKKEANFDCTQIAIVKRVAIN